MELPKQKITLKDLRLSESKDFWKDKIKASCSGIAEFERNLV